MGHLSVTAGWQNTLAYAWFYAEEEPSYKNVTTSELNTFVVGVENGCHLKPFHFVVVAAVVKLRFFLFLYIYIFQRLCTDNTNVNFNTFHQWRKFHVFEERHVFRFCLDSEIELF